MGMELSQPEVDHLTCLPTLKKRSDASNLSVPPLVTIITAVRNGVDSLARCLESVLSQDYPRIEHIVLDACSTDGTVQVLEQYQDRLAFWSSEPDSGVYDAWNKGLALAQGEWIAFLGADDELKPGAVSSYMSLAMDKPNVDYLSSQVEWVHSSGYTRFVGEPWSWPRYNTFMCSIHVGSMHRRRLFEKYGRFNVAYRITGDYEFLLRPGPSLQAAYLPETTVKMSAGGMSDSVAALIEAERARVTVGHRAKLIAGLALLWAIVKYGVKGVIHAGYSCLRRARATLPAKLP